MEVIKDFGRFALKNKKFILNIFVLLCLSAIAAAAKIIDDYVNDNRMTLVKIETAEVNGTFPFLQNDELQICLSFRGKPILNELWNYENATDLAKLVEDDLELAVRIFKNNTTSTNGKEFSFDYRVAAVVLIMALHEMDDNMMECVFHKHCDIQLSKHQVLNHVLENTTLLETLQNVWFERQNTLVMNTNSEFRRILPIQYLTLEVFCFYIPLSVLTTDLAYYMGVVGNEKIIQNNTLPFRIVLYAGNDKMYDFYHFANDSYSKVRVAIRNIGVYYKKITTECSDEAPLFRLSPYHYSDGYKNLYPTTFFDVCGCIPFRYRNFDNMFSTTSSNYRSLPYCTSKMYNNCYRDLRNGLNSLPLCTIVKNQYSIVVSPSLSIADPYTCTNERGSNDTFPCARAIVIFHCSETAYAIYEERFQLNLAQLFSQVGGDIGLYIGISFLGLWQFFALAYAEYQSHRKEQNSTSASVTKRTIEKLLMHYLEEQIETNAADSADNQHIAMTESSNSQMVERMNRMEEKFDSFTIQLERMGKQQQHFEKRVLHLIKKFEKKRSSSENDQSRVVVSDF